MLQTFTGNGRRLNKCLSEKRKRTIFNMLKFTFIYIKMSIYAEMKCKMIIVLESF